MADVIILVILLAILGGAGFYIYRARKSGRKCIGCPVSSCSTSGCSGNCAACSGDCPSCKSSN